MALQKVVCSCSRGSPRVAEMVELQLHRVAVEVVVGAGRQPLPPVLIVGRRIAGDAA